MSDILGYLDSIGLYHIINLDIMKYDIYSILKMLVNDSNKSRLHLLVLRIVICRRDYEIDYMARRNSHSKLTLLLVPGLVRN